MQPGARACSHGMATQRILQHTAADGAIPVGDTRLPVLRRSPSYVPVMSPLRVALNSTRQSQGPGPVPRHQRQAASTPPAAPAVPGTRQQMHGQQVHKRRTATGRACCSAAAKARRTRTAGASAAWRAARVRRHSRTALSQQRRSRVLRWQSSAARHSHSQQRRLQRCMLTLIRWGSQRGQVLGRTSVNPSLNLQVCFIPLVAHDTCRRVGRCWYAAAPRADTAAT